MKIADLFGNATSSNKNAKFNRIFNSLKWRQKYQNLDYYEIDLENGEVMKVQQILNGELKGFGTGTLVWPAAHVMVKYLEKKYGYDSGLKGKSVCDIGSGTGVTGYAAAALGARVVLTDQAHLLDFMQANKVTACESLKSVDSEAVTVEEYEWSSAEQQSILRAQQFDFILVSDCVLPKLYPIDILLTAVHAVMSPHSVALFSYEHRPFPQYDPREEFERLAHQLNLRVRVVPLAEHHEVFCAEDIELWEVTLSSQVDAATAAAPVPALEVLSWGSVPVVEVSVRGSRVSIKQEPAGIIGAEVWPSAVIVSRFLLTHSFAHIRALAGLPTSQSSAAAPVCVDVGAGCGLTSVALHSAGYEVIATDKPAMLPLLQHNIDTYLSNNTGSSSNSNSSVGVSVQALDWFAPVQINSSGGEEVWSRSVDLVVCSDCLYSSAAVCRLLDVLVALTSTSPECVVLLCNEMRTAFDEFTYLAGQMEGLSVRFKEVSVSEPELELFRGPAGRVASPPVRMALMRITKKPLPEEEAEV